MKEKETAQREADTSRRAQSKIRSGANSKNNFNTGKQEKSIESLLPRGKENAASSAELVQALGLSGKRELQAQVAAERERGAVICFSSEGGYYLPADRNEVAEFVAIMEHRLESTRAAVEGAKRLLRLPEGQLTFELEKEGDNG